MFKQLFVAYNRKCSLKKFFFYWNYIYEYGFQNHPQVNRNTKKSTCWRLIQTSFCPMLNWATSLQNLIFFSVSVTVSLKQLSTNQIRKTFFQGSLMRQLTPYFFYRMASCAASAPPQHYWGLVNNMHPRIPSTLQNLSFVNLMNNDDNRKRS